MLKRLYILLFNCGFIWIFLLFIIVLVLLSAKCVPINAHIDIIPIGQSCNQDTCWNIYELEVR